MKLNELTKPQLVALAIQRKVFSSVAVAAALSIDELRRELNDDE